MCIPIRHQHDIITLFHQITLYYRIITLYYQIDITSKDYVHPYPPSTQYHNLIPPNYSTYYPSRSYHQTPATEPTNKENSYSILIFVDYNIDDSIPHSEHNNPIIGNQRWFYIEPSHIRHQNKFVTLQIKTYSNIILCITGNLIRVSQQYQKKEIKVMRTERGLRLFASYTAN